MCSYAEAFDTDRDSLVHAYAPDASFSYCIHDIIAPGSVAAAFATSSDLRRFAPRKSSRNLCTYSFPAPFSSFARIRTTPFHQGLHYFLELFHAVPKPCTNLLPERTVKAQSSRSPSAPSAQNSQEQNRVVQSAQSTHLYRGPTSIVHVLKALGPHRFCAETPSELSFNVVALPLPFATDPTLGSGAGSSPTVFLTSAGDLVELRVGRAHRLSFDQSFILVRSEKIGNDSSKYVPNFHEAHSHWCHDVADWVHSLLQLDQPTKRMADGRHLPSAHRARRVAQAAPSTALMRYGIMA